MFHLFGGSTRNESLPFTLTLWYSTGTTRTVVCVTEMIGDMHDDVNIRPCCKASELFLVESTPHEWRGEWSGVLLLTSTRRRHCPTISCHFRYLFYFNSRSLRWENLLLLLV
jgi:hypothetical protein